MWHIEQTDTGWSVFAGDSLLTTVADHEAAMAALADAIADEAPAAPGEMPDESVLARWRGPIAEAKVTGDGRDFSKVEWSWRDPAAVPLPLMLQSSTDFGHMGAAWAGVMDGLSLEGGVVWAEGFLHDNEPGRALLAMLEAQGRVGVSVDPGEVEAEDVCTEEDGDGFCVDGYTAFLAYQIIGVTATPFPALEGVFIELAQSAEADPLEPVDDEDDGEMAELAGKRRDAERGHKGKGKGHDNGKRGGRGEWSKEAASLTAAAPVRPPAAWFEDPKLTKATPLTITDDGRVFGLVADFSTCHVGYRGQCVTAPDRIATAAFHTGVVRTAEGHDVATGPLVLGTDHPALDLSMSAAVDHYAHTGLAWADVRLGVTPGVGVWCAGAVRPGFDDDLSLRVIRASALSGDWRPDGAGKLALCAVLTVSVPGFPIPRATGLAASAFGRPVTMGDTRWRTRQGDVLAAVGVGRVRSSCKACGERDELASVRDALRTTDAATARAMLATLRRLDARLERLELRTTPLIDGARDRAAERVRAHLTRR